MPTPTKKIQIGFIILTVILIISLIKLGFNSLDQSKVDDPSISMSVSKKRGVFLNFVKIEPKKFSLSSEDLIINESWVEKRELVGNYLIWFEKKSVLNGFYFCIKFKENSNFYISSFIISLEPHNNSFFTTQKYNSTVHCELIKNLNYLSRSRIIKINYKKEIKEVIAKTSGKGEKE